MKILLVATVGIALVTASPVSVSRGQVLSQASEIAGVASHSADPNQTGAQPATPQAKLQGDDRQKQLAADTEKLLALATELKQQVDKSNKNTLSLGVIKKADEIEKLAHSLKERMKG
jgi:predicted Zn-dependent protease